MGLSWSGLRPEVSVGDLGKSYTFSEVLIACLSSEDEDIYNLYSV